jgi:hypothetical protein
MAVVRAGAIPEISAVRILLALMSGCLLLSFDRQ